MLMRVLLIILFICVGAARITGQGSATPPGLPDDIDQNEILRDTLVRMQIKREESDFKKLIEKAATIRETSHLLASDVKAGETAAFYRRHEKRIRELEKFARQIRSESGGGDDGKAEPEPASLDEILVRLVAASDRLNDSIARTSRAVVSVAVIESCSDVLDLVRLIRQRRN